MTFQSPEMQSQDQTGDIMKWILAIVARVNQDSKLAPNTAIQKRMQETIAREDTESIELARKQKTIDEHREKLKLTKEMYDIVCRRLQQLEPTPQSL